MIAQDPSNAIGSIIRIHKDGNPPSDNPYVENANWLPEVFQVGVRNPQGMSLDPLTNTVYISNHGPKGGDFIGPVLKGTNYGWKRVAWGGTNYSGTKVGDGNAWEPGLLKPDYIWVPSIGIGGIKFYEGDLFPEWQNSLLVGSLKFKYLSILHRSEDGFTEEEIIFKNKIGRIRDIEINQKDLRIDTFRSSGAGGQHVNKTESAIRITHIPTGLVVTCQDEKSQHKNRTAAMKVLKSRLLAQEEERLAKERADARKSMVSTGDRSAKIRTYNFPQGRITDHRINFTSYQLDGVMDGQLNEFIEQLKIADQQALLQTE